MVAWSDWQDLSAYRPVPSGLRMTEYLATGRNADRRIELFVLGDNDHVWHIWQTVPNGDWSNWQDLNAHRPLPGMPPMVGGPAMGVNADGRMELYVRDDRGHIWHIWQTGPNADWSNWQDLSTHRPMPSGLFLGNPVIGIHADGRQELFAVGSNNHVWQIWQTGPNADWSNWQDLCTHRPFPSGLFTVGRPATALNADGRMELFVRDGQGHMWHIWQTGPNADWSNWQDLSAHRPMPSGLFMAGNPVTAINADGRIELFVLGSNGHIWHIWQTGPNADWSSWQDLNAHRPLPGMPSMIGDPATGIDAVGAIELFVVGRDGHVWHIRQVAPNTDWSNWDDLSVLKPVPGKRRMIGSPVTGISADRRIELFVPDGDGQVWHLWQTSPGGG